MCKPDDNRVEERAEDQGGFDEINAYIRNNYQVPRVFNPVSTWEQFIIQYPASYYQFVLQMNERQSESLLNESIRYNPQRPQHVVLQMKIGLVLYLCVQTL